MGGHYALPPPLSHALSVTKNPIRNRVSINSIRNKFDLLASNVSGNNDVLILSETKLDESFPTEQFRMKDFAKPFRLNKSCNGGDILLNVREGYTL